MREWWEERTIGQKVLVVIGFILFGAGVALLFGFVVMWLWNWLMPDIFGLKRISYWQAWGLLVLSWILFKNFDSSDNNGSERKRKKKLREYMDEETDVEAETASDAPGTSDASESDTAGTDTPEEER